MPLPPSNPYIAGAALGGERGFFGREDILREVERTLRRPADNAIVLYGQRRIGKTSILLQLQRRLPAPPFVPIYFDLMDKARLPVGQVLYELAVTIANEVGLPAPARADFEQEPDAFQRTCLPQLYQALGDERRPVLLLDEFDVLDIAGERDLAETAAARAFRPALRRLLTTEPRLAFVFVVGRRMDELSVEFLSTFKAALRHPVSVLRPETARALILQAEREDALRYEEAAVERILALTRGHPYLTQLTCQLLFDRAFDVSPEDTPLVTVADVETAAPDVLEKGGNALQWIWDGLPPAERIIFSAIASRAQEGVVFSEDDISAGLQEAGIRILVKELNLAPQTLVNWQMLEKADGGYRFFIELMRRWVAEHRPLDQVKDELDRLVPLADTLYQAAQGFYRQGRNEPAITQLRQALEANLNHLKARLLLGAILREEGRLAEAVAEFEEAYRLDEREGRFELLRTLLQQGESLEAANDEEGALAVYNRILAISPREQTTQTRKAALWEKRGDQAMAAGDLATAMEAYRQAEADKKLAEVKSKKLKAELEQAAKEAGSYEAQEEWSKAADVYRRLIQLDSDDERWPQALKRVEGELWLAEHYAEGTGYVQQKEWGKAQKTLAEVINKRPDYKDAAELLALAKQRDKGQLDQTGVLRRRLYMVVIGGVIILVLAVGGVWGYSQTLFRTEATRLAATATAAEEAAATRLAATTTAQATASEADSATQVAIAIQGTQLAELRGTQTVEARATQTAEARRTATAAAIAAKTAQAPTATPTSTRTPRPTPTSTLTPTPIHRVLIFEETFDTDTMGWVGRDGVDSVKDGKLWLSSPLLESPDSEWMGSLASPEDPFEIKGDSTIQVTFDRRVRFSGIYFNIPEGYFSIIVSQGERATWKSNEAGLGLLRPALDKAWDNLGDIEGLVARASGVIAIKLVFVDQEMQVFVNNRLIATRVDPVFSLDKKFGGFYVGNGDSFGVEEIRVWAESTEAMLTSTPTTIPDFTNFIVGEWITTDMTVGLNGPSTGGGVWYGAYEYITFLDADKGHLLQVDTQSDGNSLRVELWGGMIKPDDHSWWVNHPQIEVSIGTGENPMVEPNSRLQWTIEPGTYTLFFACHNPSGEIVPFSVTYKIEVIK